MGRQLRDEGKKKQFELSCRSQKHTYISIYMCVFLSLMRICVMVIAIYSVLFLFNSFIRVKLLQLTVQVVPSLLW